MPNRSSRATKPLMAFMTIAALGGATLLLGQNSETLVRTSFARALQSDAAPVQAAAGPSIAQSEDFWLTALREDGGKAPALHAVSLGDRITLMLGGQEKQFRVTSVSEFPQDKTEITTAGSVRLALITARDMADATARPIRFVMENDGAPIGDVGKPARTL